jgi:hypothetical protein
MGKFFYGAAVSSFDIDDRTLAHLRIVMMNKLRRSESFMFHLVLSDGGGARSFWINPAIPIQFHFFGGRSPRINRAWVEELMDGASGPKGLRITPEPPEPVVEATAERTAQLRPSTRETVPSISG